MITVLMTSFMVGGATMLGVILGFLLRDFSLAFCDFVMSFAAGVMLCASVFGLILPAAAGGVCTVLSAAAGILIGSAVMCWIDCLSPRLHRLLCSRTGAADPQLDKVLLFVTAITIHNFPEGLASGVAFGTGNIRQALLIAGGIALQNLPEGMATVTPMLSARMPAKKSLLLGLFTGLVEIVGVWIGYLAVSAISVLLPFALSFAGGTMLYVICEEMIPEICREENKHTVSFSIMAGFCIMMVCDFLFT